MLRVSAVLLVAGCVVVTPAIVGAQSAPAIERSWVVEGGVGHAEFADSPPVPHSVFGVGTRVYLTPRLAFGPEFTLMRGSGEHRDTFLTGNVSWDLRSRVPGARVNLVPFVLGGVGIMSSTDSVGTGTYSSTEGAFTAGGGLRLESASGLYVAPDVRIGWELHWRAGVTIGFRK
jgi:hypothetical protein